MKCIRCGAEIGENENFCFVCGADAPKANAAKEQAAPLAAEQPAAAPLAAEPPAAAQPAAEPPAPAKEYRDPFSAQPQQGTPNNIITPAPAPAPQFFDTKLAPINSMGNWFGTFMILFFVPLALTVISGFVSSMLGSEHIVSTILYAVSLLSGLILVLIYAFSKRVNPSKRNFFKAYLLLIIIVIVLCVVIVFAVWPLVSSYIQPWLDQMTPSFDHLYKM